MATLKEPFALDRSLNTTEVTPRNIADVLAEGLSHITGRTASEVEYDNTDSGLTADNVQDAIDEINGNIPTVPSVDIQTAVDEFETYNGGLLSSLKVALSPNQDLHGYSEPWVGGAEKNKCDNSTNIGGYYDASGNYSASDDYRTSALIEVSANTDYTASLFDASDNSRVAGLVYTEWDASQNFIQQVANVQTITTGATTKYLRLRNYNAQTALVKSNHYAYQLEQGSSATSYAPYSNICPISGHTQVEVENHQKNLFNPSNVIIGYIGQSGGAYKIIAYADARTIYARCEPNTTYTISKTAGKRFSVGWSDTLPDIGVIVNDSVYDATASVVTFTTGATAKYIVAFVWLGTQDTITADEMLASCQIELGSTATAYEPYNGYQVTVNLGGTYYSGTLDVVTGEFVPDTAVKDLSTLTFRTASRNRWLSDSIISEVKHPSSSTLKIKFWSDSYYYTDAQDLYDDQTLIGIAVDNDGNILCRNNDANPPTGYIVYELANPTPIQLIPTPVKANVGENHLDAPLEGQEITESKYKQMFTFDDVIAYIQSLS